MITRFSEIGLKICDLLLGWTLFLPRDVSLLIVAMLSAILLWGVRRSLVNHFKMRRIKADVHRLRTLTQIARTTGDQEALRRHHRNRGRVAWYKLKAELPSVLVSTLLFLMIIQWGERRLAHFSLQENEPFQFRVEFPASAEKRLTHIVPVNGLEAVNGWIQKIERPARTDFKTIASWTLIADSGRYTLLLRYRGQTFEHPISVGTGEKLPIDLRQTDLILSTIQLKEYHPFSVLPGLKSIGMAPWLIGFLLVFTPFYLRLVSWDFSGPLPREPHFATKIQKRLFHKMKSNSHKLELLCMIFSGFYPI